MEPTQELKDVLAFALSVHMAYDKAKADGKIDLTDLPLAVGPIMKLLPAIDGISKVPAELKDLTDEERDALMEWAKAEYDIADDALEALVEGGIALALHVAQYVGALLPDEAPTEPAA